MPLKLVKEESDNLLRIGRIMHAKRYVLTLDRNWCKGCGICVEVCPREAISLMEITRPEEGRADPPQIDIDVERCQYCGICNAICPFGALSLEIDDERRIPVVKAESFPSLIRDLRVNPDECDESCMDCKDVCPLGLIHVQVVSQEEKPKDLKSLKTKEDLKFKIDVDLEHCPCCRICEYEGPTGVFQVKKIISGTLNIKKKLCPEGCRACLDVCPIPGALYMGDDGKVDVNELFCVYCGACKLVCPVEEALELERTRISHVPVRSGTWNKALEKLASTKAMVKTLRTKSAMRAIAAVEKRVPGRS